METAPAEGRGRCPDSIIQEKKSCCKLFLHDAGGKSRTDARTDRKTTEEPDYHEDDPGNLKNHRDWDQAGNEGADLEVLVIFVLATSRTIQM